MPAVFGCRPEAAQRPGVGRAVFCFPTAGRLVADVEPALGQRTLNILNAQVEAEAQPDRTLIATRQRMMAGTGVLRQLLALPRDCQFNQLIPVTKTSSWFPTLPSAASSNCAWRPGAFTSLSRRTKSAVQFSPRSGFQTNTAAKCIS